MFINTRRARILTRRARIPTSSHMESFPGAKGVDPCRACQILPPRPGPMPALARSPALHPAPVLNQFDGQNGKARRPRPVRHDLAPTDGVN
jgi:hypothetical protein